MTLMLREMGGSDLSWLYWSDQSEASIGISDQSEASISWCICRGVWHLVVSTLSLAVITSWELGLGHYRERGDGWWYSGELHTHGHKIVNTPIFGSFRWIQHIYNLPFRKSQNRKIKDTQSRIWNWGQSNYNNPQSRHQMIRSSHYHPLSCHQTGGRMSPWWLRAATHRMGERRLMPSSSEN